MDLSFDHNLVIEVYLYDEERASRNLELEDKAAEAAVIFQYPNGLAKSAVHLRVGQLLGLYKATSKILDLNSSDISNERGSISTSRGFCELCPIDPRFILMVWVTCRSKDLKDHQSELRGTNIFE